MNRMSKVGIPSNPINTVDEVIEDPQIKAREMVYELIHPEYGPLRVLGIPIKLSETPGALETAPPRFGEHNREVLASLGYDSTSIEELFRQNVIAETK